MIDLRSKRVNNRGMIFLTIFLGYLITLCLLLLSMVTINSLDRVGDADLDPHRKVNSE